MREKLKLYLVTDAEILKNRDFYACVEAALKGGVTALQLRDKTCSDEVFLETAKRLALLAKQYDALFFINDRVALAKELGAEGIHVGQSDLAAKDVKALVGEQTILGVSATTLEEAIQAEKDGADYIGVGAMFQTGTKTDAKLVTKEVLAQILQAVNIPVVLIGGLTLENIGMFKEMNVAGYAVVSAILGAEDIGAEASKWRTQIG